MCYFWRDLRQKSTCNLKFNEFDTCNDPRGSTSSDGNTGTPTNRQEVAESVADLPGFHRKLLSSSSGMRIEDGGSPFFQNVCKY
jgi:hypothetical protein